MQKKEENFINFIVNINDFFQSYKLILEGVSKNEV